MTTAISDAEAREAAIAAATAALVAARRGGQPQPAPPLPDAAAAYEVQARVAAALGWFGPGVPRHWKSGGPSREAVPTHAPLPPHGVRDSGADLRDLPLRVRGIEAEVALRLACAVGPDEAAALRHEDAGALVDAMAVSVEIVDSRWLESLDAPGPAKTADQQVHGALVLGDWVPYVATDWSQQRCHVRLGERAPIERRGTHPAGDPLFVLPGWLRHVTRDGAVVPAGTVVTTGTWCGLLLAAAGERVAVEFPGIGLAELQL